ncbi:MAG TPA: hypothetical protein PLV45_14520 [bacterium]|nr:hypothetical protein [bacterium]
MKKKWIFIISGCVVFIILSGVMAVRYGIGLLEKRMKLMTIWVEDIDTGNAMPIPSLQRCRYPVFSPDGQRITCIESEGNGFDRIGTYDLETGDRDILIPALSGVNSIAWHPDGRAIFYSAEEDSRKDIWRYNLEDHSRTRLTDDPAGEYRLRISADGRRLLFTQKTDEKREDLYMMDADGGEKQRMTDARNLLEDIEYMAWAPNSREFAFVSFLKMVIMNIDGDIVNEISLAGLNNIREPFFSPESDDVIYFMATGQSSITTRVNLYRLSRRSGSFEIWKEGRSLMEFFFSISPDGRKLVYIH